jgi:hypothetical protein
MELMMEDLHFDGDDVGLDSEALQTIRDSGRPSLRLYRSYGTFDAYCRKRWGFTEAYASRLIAASQAVQLIKTLPIGKDLPATETHARQLIRLRTEAGNLDAAKIPEGCGDKGNGDLPGGGNAQHHDVDLLSLNLRRRHLKQGQKFICAAKAEALREKYKAEAKERQKRKPADSVRASLPEQNPDAGRARDKLGKLFGVGGRTVDDAVKVVKYAVPEVVEAVSEGRMAVALRHEEQHHPGVAGVDVVARRPANPTPFSTSTSMRG